MRYYYVNRTIKEVHIYDFEQETELEYLGASENTMTKMVVASFLPGEKGYKITSHP